MQPTPPRYGFHQIAQELVRVVLDTVVEPRHLSPERKPAVRQAVICSMMVYNPRDPVEASIAGHCVVYDRVIHDAARDTLRCQDEQLKFKARHDTFVAGKIFISSVQALFKMQSRAHETLVYAREVDPPAEPATQPAPAEPVAVDDAASTVAPTPESTQSTDRRDQAAEPATQPAPAEPATQPAPAEPAAVAVPRVTAAPEPTRFIARHDPPQAAEPAQPAKPAHAETPPIALVPKQHPAAPPMLSAKEVHEMVLAGMAAEAARNAPAGRTPAGAANVRPAEDPPPDPHQRDRIALTGSPRTGNTRPG